MGLLLLGLVTTARADLTTGLVPYYPFDGNASDMSGNGNDGTVNGATSRADRHGIAGKAYSFDGDDDILLDDSLKNFVPTTNQGATFAFWASVETLGYLISQYTNGEAGNSNFLVMLDGANGFQLIGNGTGAPNVGYIRDEVTRQLNAWNHWVFQIHPGVGACTVHLNGTLISTGSTVLNGTTTSKPILMGAISNNSGKLTGSLDDIRIYDRALSAVEVAALYQMESELPAASVTPDKLTPELSDLLDGNGTIEQALPAGSVIAVKPGDPAPVGYTLFQRNEYNATLTWEEKAPVSVARYAYDGVEALNGKIYFVGGANTSTFSIAERYDPAAYLSSDRSHIAGRDGCGRQVGPERSYPHRWRGDRNRGWLYSLSQFIRRP